MSAGVPVVPDTPRPSIAELIGFETRQTHLCVTGTGRQMRCPACGQQELADRKWGFCSAAPRRSPSSDDMLAWLSANVVDGAYNTEGVIGITYSPDGVELQWYCAAGMDGVRGSSLAEALEAAVRVVSGWDPKEVVIADIPCEDCEEIDCVCVVSSCRDENEPCGNCDECAPALRPPCPRWCRFGDPCDRCRYRPWRAL